MIKDIKSSNYIVPKIIGSAVILFLAVWFFLPYFRAGLNEGTAFAHLGCVWVLFLIWGAPSLVKKSRFLKMIIYVLASLTALLAIWFVFLSFKILTSIHHENLPQNTTVMVLGARVNEDRQVSKTLANRLDVAYDYIKENPDSFVILTGGQGHDEPMTEALAQKEYLINLGIDEGRMLLEDKSTSTRENMEYSLPLIEGENLEKTIIVATQDFHMYRALELAKDNGYTAYPLAAVTDPMLFPAHYSRELLALTKYYLEKTFLGK